MPGMETVGKRLQHVRNLRGLTLDQLAERAGISKSFLSEVEHDRSGITGEKLLRVANALGASLDFLLREFHGMGDIHGQLIEQFELLLVEKPQFRRI